MRTEKFEVKENSYQNDDIQVAFEYNGLSERLKDIDVILAEVTGENDGCNWHWLLQLKDGKFAYAEGGCDYTGWDCQSHASISDSVGTVKEALALAPELDSYDRKIREFLERQVLGDLPFGLHEEINK